VYVLAYQNIYYKTMQNPSLGLQQDLMYEDRSIDDSSTV